jgi:iron complex outermembrane receptor protein
MVTPYQQIAHFKIASDNNFSFGSDRLSVNIGYQRNQRKEFGDPAASNIPDLHFDLQTINYNLQYSFAEKTGWKTSIGATGMYQQNRNLASEVLIPEYNQFDIGAFVYTKKTFNNNLTLSGGITCRQQNVTGKTIWKAAVKFAGFNKSFGNISGSIGLGYSASDAVTLKFNLARGFRAPSVSELASNGAHEGTNRYEYGDNNLKTETSFQADAGLEVTRSILTFSLNAFYNNIQNYIFYSKLEGANGS